MEMLRKLITAGICLAVLVSGFIGLTVLVATKTPPERRAAARPLPQVEVLAIEPAVFEAPIIGYGTVRPKRQVKIIPEVGGRLVKVHEDLAVGNIIAKGELLFEIDARVYKSKLRQVEAEISRLKTQLRRHEEVRISLEKRLGIAQQQVRLAAKDFERERDLFEDGGSRAPAVEQAEQRYLLQQDAVLAIESELTLIPLRIEETNALLDTKRAQLEEAKLNVARTKIRCPFDARVDAITAQESQVVIASFQIAILTDMEALEIPVVIDPRELRWTDQKAFAQAVGRDLGDAPEARITWTLHGREFSWTGKITRLERMDEVTRSAHIVVEIRDIMRSLELTKGEGRLPLSVGMFCLAELPTEPLEDAIVVPRHALHDEAFVYVFTPDPSDPSQGRLAIKHVPVLRSVDDQVLVAYRQQDADRAAPAEPRVPDNTAGPAELCPGDLIVVSPLPKAVEGMRLARRGATQVIASVDSPGDDAIMQSAVAAPVVARTHLLGAATGAR